MKSMLSIVVTLVVALPGAARGQVSPGATLGYRPDTLALARGTSALWTPNRVRLEVRNLTVVTSRRPMTAAVLDRGGSGGGPDDPYRTGTSPVTYGAITGGLIGGAFVAVHTLRNTTDAPVDWGVALTAPIIGAALGAGIGLLFH